MTVADKHIEALKAEFRKQKGIDPDGHVNDWVALLLYQSLNGDGLYATIGQLQTIVAGAIEGHIENLSPEEARTLTQEAYEKSERLMNMDFWEDQNIEEDPQETGLIFNDAIQIYLDELLWQKIDKESFEMETEDDEEDEESLDDLSATEVLDKLEEELDGALNSAKLDVKLFALQIQGYIERLRELTDD